MIGQISASNQFRTSSELAPKRFGVSSELPPNMFGDSSEPGSVMEFGLQIKRRVQQEHFHFITFGQ